MDPTYFALWVSIWQPPHSAKTPWQLVLGLQCSRWNHCQEVLRSYGFHTMEARIDVWCLSQNRFPLVNSLLLLCRIQRQCHGEHGCEIQCWIGGWSLLWWCCHIHTECIQGPSPIAFSQMTLYSPANVLSYHVFTEYDGSQGWMLFRVKLESRILGHSTLCSCMSPKSRSSDIGWPHKLSPDAEWFKCSFGYLLFSVLFTKEASLVPPCFNTSKIWAEEHTYTIMQTQMW